MVQRSSWAVLLGRGLAHAQDVCDVLIGLGFQAMKKTGHSMEERKPADGKYKVALRRFGKSTLTFLGSMGDAYYEKYGELKAKEAKDGKAS